MANSRRIVYLSSCQYAELLANGTITVNDVTVTYDENDIYVTPQAEPVTDVQVNGTSVVSSGVANVPIATDANFGVVKGSTSYGVKINANGELDIDPALIATIRSPSGISASRKPITPSHQHESTFYGLAKVAGHDEASSAKPLGTYTPEAKGAIQTMLGTNTMLAPDENDLVADRDYAIGDLFTSNGKVYKATAEILTGVAIVTFGNNANCEETTISDAFVKDVQVNGSSIVQDGKAEIPLMGSGTSGLIQYRGGYGLQLIGNYLLVQPATDTEIKNNSGTRSPIVSEKQHASVFYGLAKAAGDATQSQSDKPVGQYTDAAKTAIKTMLGIEEGSSSSEVVTPIDDTAGVGDTAKVWSADKTSIEINNIIDTAPTEELAADLLMQEETNTYLNEKFLSSIHNMFESLPQDEILSEILEGLVDGNGLLRQLYHELEARKLAAE